MTTLSRLLSSTVQVPWLLWLDFCLQLFKYLTANQDGNWTLVQSSFSRFVDSTNTSGIGVHITGNFMWQNLTPAHLHAISNQMIMIVLAELFLWKINNQRKEVVFSRWQADSQSNVKLSRNLHKIYAVHSAFFATLQVHVWQWLILFAVQLLPWSRRRQRSPPALTLWPLWSRSSCQSHVYQVPDEALLPLPQCPWWGLPAVNRVSSS